MEFVHSSNFELAECYMIKMKKLHWTDSEFDRTYFMFLNNTDFTQLIN